MEQKEITKLRKAMEISSVPSMLFEKIKVSESYYERLKSEHKQIISNDPRAMMGVPIEIDDSITSEYELVCKTLT